MKKDSNGRSKLIEMFVIFSVSLALRNSYLFLTAEEALTVVVKILWFSVKFFSASTLPGIAFAVVVAEEADDVIYFFK